MSGKPVFVVTKGGVEGHKVGDKIELTDGRVPPHLLNKGRLEGGTLEVATPQRQTKAKAKEE